MKPTSSNPAWRAIGSHFMTSLIAMIIFTSSMGFAQTTAIHNGLTHVATGATKLTVQKESNGVAYLQASNATKEKGGFGVSLPNVVTRFYADYYAENQPTASTQTFEAIGKTSNGLLSFTKTDKGLDVTLTKASANVTATYFFDADGKQVLAEKVTSLTLPPNTEVVGMGFGLLHEGKNTAGYVLDLNEPTTYKNQKVSRILFAYDQATVLTQAVFTQTNATVYIGTETTIFAPISGYTFSPTTAKAGDVVTVTGVNVGAATSLIVGTQLVDFSKVDAKTLKFTVPAYAKSGVLTLANLDGVATTKEVLTVLQMPQVPTELFASVIRDEKTATAKAYLKWKAVVNAMNYEVQFRTLGKDWKTVIVTETKTVVDLPLNLNGEFRIRAMTKNTSQSYSDWSESVAIAVLLTKNIMVSKELLNAALYVIKQNGKIKLSSYLASNKSLDPNEVAGFMQVYNYKKSSVRSNANISVSCNCTNMGLDVKSNSIKNNNNEDKTDNRIKSWGWAFKGGGSLGGVYHDYSYIGSGASLKMRSDYTKTTTKSWSSYSDSHTKSRSDETQSINFLYYCENEHEIPQECECSKPFNVHAASRIKYDIKIGQGTSSASAKAGILLTETTEDSQGGNKRIKLLKAGAIERGVSRSVTLNNNWWSSAVDILANAAKLYVNAQGDSTFKVKPSDITDLAGSIKTLIKTPYRFVNTNGQPSDSAFTFFLCDTTLLLIPNKLKMLTLTSYGEVNNSFSGSAWDKSIASFTTNAALSITAGTTPLPRQCCTPSAAFWRYTSLMDGGQVNDAVWSTMVEKINSYKGRTENWGNPINSNSGWNLGDAECCPFSVYSIVPDANFTTTLGPLNSNGTRNIKIILNQKYNENLGYIIRIYDDSNNSTRQMPDQTLPVIAETYSPNITPNAPRDVFWEYTLPANIAGRRIQVGVFCENYCRRETDVKGQKKSIPAKGGGKPKIFSGTVFDVGIIRVNVRGTVVQDDGTIVKGVKGKYELYKITEKERVLVSSSPETEADNYVFELKREEEVFGEYIARYQVGDLEATTPITIQDEPTEWIKLDSKVYPNPTERVGFVKFVLVMPIDNAIGNLVMVNSAGTKLIYTSEVKLHEGENMIEIPVPTGGSEELYVISVKAVHEGKGYLATQKLLVK